MTGESHPGHFAHAVEQAFSGLPAVLNLNSVDAMTRPQRCADEQIPVRRLISRPLVQGTENPRRSI